MKIENELVFEKTIDSKTFRYIRKSLELTQKEMACLLNVSIATVKRFETEDASISGPVAILMQLYYLNRSIVKFYLPKTIDFDTRLIYKNHDVATAIIDVDTLKKQINVVNIAEDPYLLPFGNNRNPTYDDYIDLLKDRCFPENGQNAPFELKKIGLPFYDPFMIVCKTKGRVYGDYFSLEVVSND